MINKNTCNLPYIHKFSEIKLLKFSLKCGIIMLREFVMYLKLLEQNNIKIRRLASKFLGKKYHQHENIMWCKIMGERLYEKEEYYRCSVTDLVNVDLVSTEHIFNDFGYASNDDRGEHEISCEINVQWVKIVYDFLSNISAELSKRYLNDAREVLNSECSSYKDEVEKKAKEVYTKTISKAKAEIKNLCDSFSNSLGQNSNQNIGDNEVEENGI